MRRRCDPIVMPTGFHSGSHSTSELRVADLRHGLVISDVPPLWKQHARRPWRVIFPDLDWPPIGASDED